jgi:hypothetical protein
MRNALRLCLRVASLGTFLAILASPPVAPTLALGSSFTPPQSSKSLCPKSFSGSGLGYDGDAQRCVIGGGGCFFN